MCGQIGEMTKASSVFRRIGPPAERLWAVEPTGVLGLAAAFYFVMCFGIDRLGRLLERHLALKGFAGQRA